ncbi:MAG: hypothetical protein GY937_14230 [bacterium]|nr:hypothetical protein [bacterium]
MSTRWIAPGLLVAVACSQIVLAHTADLSPWLGGGFGMFATLDSRGERHLAIFAESPGLLHELDLPSELEHRAEAVRALPTRTRLLALAREVAAAEEGRIPGLQSVRIQLWQTRREPGSLRYDEAIEREVQVEAP